MSAATTFRSSIAPASRLHGMGRWIIPIALALVASAPSPAGAQVLTGILTGVVRDSSGVPVSSAIVTVGHRSVSTGETGEFRMPGLTLGAVVVTVRRLGYEMRTFPAMVGRMGDSLATLSVVMHPVPAGLEAITVQAQRDARELQLTGFYERQRAGIGRFITRDQIEQRRSSSFMEVLRSMVPGMQLNGSGRTPNRTVQFRNSRCAPLVVLDGFPMTSGNFDLTSINPVTVLGVEVYAGPATVPAKFRDFRSGESCGVIAIWFGVSKPNVMRSPTAAEFAYADSASPVSVAMPVYSAHEVDKTAQVDNAQLVAPIFPDSLFANGETGEVLAQFVVDVSGFVLPNSIHLESTAHPGFKDSVHRALALSRFVPARKNGAPVRQVMVLPYRFVKGDLGQLQR